VGSPPSPPSSPPPPPPWWPAPGGGPLLVAEQPLRRSPSSPRRAAPVPLLPAEGGAGPRGEGRAGPGGRAGRLTGWSEVGGFVASAGTLGFTRSALGAWSRTWGYLESPSRSWSFPGALREVGCVVTRPCSKNPSGRTSLVIPVRGPAPRSADAALFRARARVARAVPRKFFATDGVLGPLQVPCRRAARRAAGPGAERGQKLFTAAPPGPEPGHDGAAGKIIVVIPGTYRPNGTPS